MADFTHGFWSWYIILITFAGLAGVLWLVWWMSVGGNKAKKVQTMGHVWDDNLEELNNPLPRWWLVMFYGCILASVVYLALYPGLGAFQGLLGWSAEKQYQEEMRVARKAYGPIFDKYLNTSVAALAEDPEARHIGARLFGTYCAVCHGSDAKGAPGFPNLTDDDWLYGGTPDSIKTSIMEGRHGNMPAWESALGRKSVFNVAEYVRSLSGHAINSTAAKAGEATFKQMCSACHGTDGAGNHAMGAPNLTDDVWLYGGSQKAVLETIAKGRSGLMPAHKVFPGEAKAHLLAGYVYGLSRQPGKELVSSSAGSTVAATGHL